MKKGTFSQLAATILPFLLISSAAVPAFAAGVAVGDGATASGGGVAIGDGVTSTGTVVIGSLESDVSTLRNTGATTYGIKPVAIGYNASAKAGDNGYRWGDNSSYAIGANATSGDRGYALGFNSIASGAKPVYSVAIGANSSAKATNSVALGSGSVASLANTVSVGSPGHERQITNVADGTTDTDAINVGQLHRMGAMAAAISGLTPLPYIGNERFQVLASGGVYDAQQATAIGAVYYDARKPLMVTTGMAFSSGETMARLGIAWKLGPAGKENLLAAGVDPQATIRYQDSQIEQIQNQINQQQEQVKQQQEKYKERQDQLKQLQDQVNQLLKTQGSQKVEW